MKRDCGSQRSSHDDATARRESSIDSARYTGDASKVIESGLVTAASNSRAYEASVVVP